MKAMQDRVGNFRGKKGGSSMQDACEAGTGILVAGSSRTNDSP